MASGIPGKITAIATSPVAVELPGTANERATAVTAVATDQGHISLVRGFVVCLLPV